MKTVKNIIELLLFIIAIILFFYNWKIALIVLWILWILNTYEKWPSSLLFFLSWYTSLYWLIFLFSNFTIWIILLITWYLISYFRIKWDEINYIYYWIITELKNKYNLKINSLKPHYFEKWNEWTYVIEFNWKKFNVDILETWKFHYNEIT